MLNGTAIQQGGGTIQTNEFTRTSTVTFTAEASTDYTFVNWSNSIIAGWLVVRGAQTNDVNPFHLILHIDGVLNSNLAPEVTFEAPAFCQFQGLKSFAQIPVLVSSSDGDGNAMLQIRHEANMPCEITIDAYGTNLPTLSISGTNDSPLSFSETFVPVDKNISANQFIAKQFSLNNAGDILTFATFNGDGVHLNVSEIDATTDIDAAGKITGGTIDPDVMTYNLLTRAQVVAICAADIDPLIHGRDANACFISDVGQNPVKAYYVMNDNKFYDEIGKVLPSPTAQEVEQAKAALAIQRASKKEQIKNRLIQEGKIKLLKGK